MGISSSARIPAGFIMPYGGGTPPAGFLECAGQAVSRANFAALFLAISTIYGVGDGSTTFNLPDLRGRSMFGKDNMNGTAANRLTAVSSGVDGATLGAVGGGESVTLTAAQMPSHAHTQDAHNHGQNSHNHTQVAHAHGLTVYGVQDTNLAARAQATGSATGIAVAGGELVNATNLAETASNLASTATNQGTGSSSAHQNIPPAIVTFMMIKT